MAISPRSITSLLSNIPKGTLLSYPFTFGDADGYCVKNEAVAVGKAGVGESAEALDGA